jgi:uncharacterized protein YuzE
MDGNISKALWIGVGVLFFIAVVSLGLSLLDQGKGIAQEQSLHLASVQKRLVNSGYDIYDNQEVVGSQVMSAIRGYRQDAEVLYIYVQTKKDQVTYLNSVSDVGGVKTLGGAHTEAKIDSMIKDARTESNRYYINPIAKFDALIKRDSNGVVCGIEFIQK